MTEITNSTPIARTARDPGVGRGALPALAATDLGAWQSLADRAIEPNGYYLPQWALAANFDAGASAQALTARDQSGALIGLLPVISAWRAFRLPLPALVCADPFHSLNTPLLDRDAAEQAVIGLMQCARQAGAHALLLRTIPPDGRAADAFSRVLAADGLRPQVLTCWQRACLDARQDPQTVLRDALGPKKLKNLHRLRHRLAEQHGEVSFAAARDAADVGRAFDIFLALEASGWKGRRGTALAQHGDNAARLRRAAIDLAARGQCEVVSLHAGPTPVAAGIVLRHQSRAFFFKLGVDERFLHYSPGVQLTLDLTRHLCADPQITDADSTAGPGHPMIDPIWRGRLAIGDVLIPLRRHDPLAGTIGVALRARGFARAAAQRLLRR